MWEDGVVRVVSKRPDCVQRFDAMAAAGPVARRASHAGSWYAARKADLAGQLAGFLAKAGKGDEIEGTPRAIICESRARLLLCPALPRPCMRRSPVRILEVGLTAAHDT